MIKRYDEFLNENLINKIKNIFKDTDDDKIVKDLIENKDKILNIINYDDEYKFNYNNMRFKIVNYFSGFRLFIIENRTEVEVTSKKSKELYKIIQYIYDEEKRLNNLAEKQDEENKLKKESEKFIKENGGIISIIENLLTSIDIEKLDDEDKFYNGVIEISNGNLTIMAPSGFDFDSVTSIDIDLSTKECEIEYSYPVSHNYKFYKTILSEKEFKKINRYINLDKQRRNKIIQRKKDIKDNFFK